MIPPTTAIGSVNLRRGDERVQVVVSGEADLALAPLLRQRLQEAIEQSCDTLVVDLTATTFLDSSALGALLGAVRRLREEGRDLELIIATRPVQRLLALTGVDRLLAVHDVRET